MRTPPKLCRTIILESEESTRRELGDGGTCGIVAGGTRALLAPHPALLALREVRISLHFYNLLGVTLAVGGDKESPLIRIEFLAQWTVSSVIA